MGEFGSSGEGVEFNEAFAQVQRIDKTEQLDAEARSKLYSPFAEDKKEGFVESVALLNNLYTEIQAELKEDELKQVRLLKGFLDQATIDVPFYTLTQNQGMGRGKVEGKIDLKIFGRYKKILEEYRLLISKLKKKHGFSNPSKSNPGKAVYN